MFLTDGVLPVGGSTIFEKCTSLGYRVAAARNFREESEAVIHEHTGYVVQMKKKEHLPFMMHIASSAARRESVSGRFDANTRVLLDCGECVPCAMAHSTCKYATVAQHIANRTVARMASKLRGGWSYRSWSGLVKLKKYLVAVRGLPNAPGKWLLHVDNGFSPHCVACAWGANDEVSVTDGDVEYLVCDNADHANKEVAVDHERLGI